MTHHRLHAVLCAALLLGAAASFDANAQGKGEGVRPEVGKPLQAAQALVKQRKGREAMAEIAKAEAVPNRTAYENQVIAQMKAAASSAAGDNEATIRNNTALLDSGKVSGREATALVQGIAVAHYNMKQYGEAARWTQRYFKEGGSDPSMRTVLLQSYYLGNDCASVNKILGSAVEENRHATEDELGYRLRLATGNLTSTNDYLEMAQLALQAGVPAEAKVIVDKGYEVKALGQGPEAGRHQRLRDLVMKDLAESQKNRAKDEADALAAKDGNDLVKVGLNYVYEGSPDKGLALIEQGIKKGGLKRPEDAKLRLGEAQIYTGHKAKGVQTLREVKGNDGAADIARLWILNART